MRRVVIVGAGLAGLSAADELRRRGHDGELTIIGAERHKPYRRPPLSKHPLPTSHADVALGQADRLEATWLLGSPARGLDTRRRVVELEDGTSLGYDGLVIATGSRARELPPALRRNLRQVLTIRGIDDLVRLQEHLLHAPRVVILGGGFLGSELAGSLRARGLAVDIVERERLPLLGPLGEVVAGRVTRAHRDAGVGLHVGRVMSKLIGTAGVEAVLLDDGTVLAADLVITATGSEPDTRWLRGSQISLDGGVLVDRTGAAAPGVVSAGDVARWPHPWETGARIRVEHYNGALAQGAHVAGTLLGDARPYRQPPSFWAHIHDLRLHSVGFTGARYRLHWVKQGADGRFLAEYCSGTRVVGAIAHGHVRDLAVYRTTHLVS
jgi:NADPH-dependent 2,4-dienoyl-CoA reductase/sulfur reductase-like enzyme